MADPKIINPSNANNNVEITITPGSMKITSPVTTTAGAKATAEPGSTNDIRIFPTYDPVGAIHPTGIIPTAIREAGALRDERANTPVMQRSIMQGLKTNNTYDATFGISTSKAIVPDQFVEQRPDGSYGLKENARLTLVANKEYTGLFRFHPESATITRNERGQFEISIESKLEPTFLSRLAVANGALKIFSENNAANEGNPQLSGWSAELKYNGSTDPSQRNIQVAGSYKNQNGANMLQIEASGQYFISPDFRQTVNASIAASRIGLAIEIPKQQNTINNKKQSSLNNGISGNNINRQTVQAPRQMVRL
jgi:hypothetical protein